MSTLSYLCQLQRKHSKLKNADIKKDAQSYYFQTALTLQSDTPTTT